MALASLAAPYCAAQATRTWVSGVGDDANPCSRTAPCKTFAGAISKTAEGGEINALDPGGYGAVTINKSITISGDGTMAGVVVSGTNAIIVNAGPGDVVILRNLVLDGLVATGSGGTNAINFLAGGELHVESLRIFGFAQNGILFQPSGASALFVSSTSIRNNNGGAVHILPGISGTAIATLDHVSMEGNGFGLRAEDGSRVLARDTTASGNASNGFAAAATFRPADVSLETCVAMFNNQAGVLAGPLSTVKMSNVLSSKNNLGIQSVSGGALVSFGNNKIFGNVTADGSPTSTSSPI
jgi:hypothetical protein